MIIGQDNKNREKRKGRSKVNLKHSGKKVVIKNYTRYKNFKSK